MTQTITQTVPLHAFGEYRRIRKSLIGGASWISSKLPGHAVDYDINYDNETFTLKVTVRFMGEEYDAVKNLERVACGDMGHQGLSGEFPFDALKRK